jgi:hypothetical protein
MDLKKKLLIIFLIIYLIIFYCWKYIIGFDSTEKTNNIELKVPEQVNTNPNPIKNLITLTQTQSEKSSEPVTIKIDDIEGFNANTNSEILSNSSSINLSMDCETKYDEGTKQTKTSCEIKINSDGSDITNYTYKTNWVEGFDNSTGSEDKIKPKYPEMKTPRNIWVYWENINRSKYPTHIKLCLDSIKKHLGTKYNLQILNEKSIREYLPDARGDFDNLMVAQKVDYYRIALLYKYGGIWLDADIIVMQDLEPIFRKLDEGYDYVGFGCTGAQCSNGKFRPSNWVLGARPSSVLMELVLDKLNTKLSNRDKDSKQDDSTYHDYGKMVIWEALDDLKPQGYDYYHFTSEYDGTRDSNKYWVHTPEFFKTNPTKLLDESKVLFMVLYNSEISSRKDLHWIRDCTDSELLYSKIWLGELYRKALGII